MKRKTLYAGIVVLLSVWLGFEAVIRAQGGGDGGRSGRGQTGPSSAPQGEGTTPNVPGSGPASPIDQPPGTSTPVQSPQMNGGSRAGLAPADAAVADRVRSAISNDPGLTAFNQRIDVVSANGVIRLRGRVGTPQERQLIGAKAAQIVGTNRVDNQIVVSNQIR